MKNFNMLSLDAWQKVKQDNLFVYPAPAGQPAVISGSFVSDKLCRVFVGSNPDMDDAKLVAVGDGLVSFKVSAPPNDGKYYLGFESASDHVVFRSSIVDQAIAKSTAKSFTRIAPKRKALPPEMVEALRAVEENGRRRMQALVDRVRPIVASSKPPALPSDASDAPDTQGGGDDPAGDSTADTSV